MHTLTEYGIISAYIMQRSAYVTISQNHSALLYLRGVGAALDEVNLDAYRVVLTSVATTECREGC